MKTIVVFASNTGNTAAMAAAICEGARATGATLVNGQGVIAQLTPDSTALEECRALGAQLV